MQDIIIRKAGLEDKLLLSKLFQHYKSEEMIKKRIECYLSHNNTIIAIEDNQLIGIIQWNIKEDPNLGVVEFEEIFVVKEFREKGVGSALLKFSIQIFK